MVDGVPGYVDHVLRHVVEEYKHQLEDVIILHLPAEEVIVLAQISSRVHATPIVVLVRISTLSHMLVLLTNTI